MTRLCVMLMLAFSALSLIPAAQALPLEARPQNAVREVRVGVNGMVCDFCAQTLKKTFAKESAVDHVDISLENKNVTIFLKPGQSLDEQTIAKRITDAGYAVTTVTWE